jgi:Tfp pilus assembly protein PilF
MVTAVHRSHCSLVRPLVCAVLVLVAAFGGYRGYRFLRTERWLRAAEKARQQREFDQARRDLAAVLDIAPNDSRAHFSLARIARQAGFYEEAEDQLEICQRLEGPTERIALERSLIQVQQGALSRAKEVQLRSYVTGGHPEGDQILEALSRGCLAAYRLESALGYLNEWLDRRPDNVQAYLWRATVRERLVDNTGAVDDCRAAFALAPEDPEAQLRLAQALLVAGRAPEEAAERFEALYQQSPGHPVVMIGLAKAWTKLNRMDDAERLLDQLVAKHPDEAPVLLERGRLALQRGQPGRAEQWLRRAATLAPSDYQTNYALLQCLNQQGKMKDAKEIQDKLRGLEADGARFRELTERLRQEPYDIGIRCEIARLFLREGQGTEVLHWLQTALKIDPRSPEANRLMAEYYEQNGQPVLARQYRQNVNPAAEVAIPSEP